MLKRLALLIALCLACASPSWATTSYFLSPSGSDAANGLTTGTAWLSPNHAVNCGDTITAASGTYSAANFQSGKWGTVTCAGSNNVAWVICATFDACKVSSTTSDAIHIDKSYWGVVGWEATTTTSQFGGCFVAAAVTSGVNIHHIIFADDVANGCMGGGFTTYNLNGTTGVDYLVIVGNIAYNAAQGNTHCFSGISVYQPVASDSNSGTHIYVAGNFSYANVNPATCNGTASTDGEGIILDTWDTSQTLSQTFPQQGVAQNNIVFFNGGRGIEAFGNRISTPNATMIVKYNTAFGDMTDNNQTSGCLGRSDIAPDNVKNTTLDHNLAQTKTGLSCMSGALYASFAEQVDSSDTATNNWFYSAAGNHTGIDNGTGFSYTSTTSTNPSFTSAVNPGAPSCGSNVSTVDCASTIIADYAPTTSGANAFGYQTVSNTSITDSLFPAWLCTSTGVLNVNIPTNLITPGCGVISGGGGGHLNGTVNGGMLTFAAEDWVKWFEDGKYQ